MPWTSLRVRRDSDRTSGADMASPAAVHGADYIHGYRTCPVSERPNFPHRQLHVILREPQTVSPAGHRPQHFLCLRPEPHGHGALRTTFAADRLLTEPWSIEDSGQLVTSTRVPDARHQRVDFGVEILRHLDSWE